MGLLGQRSDEDDEERGDISIAGLEHLDGTTDDTDYELDEWTDRGRALLRERLETLGVPHRWVDRTTLVISTPDEAWVERIMDQVEDDLSLALDPDVAQVAYDLTDWDALGRERLFDVLEDEAVPYGVDGEELFVHEIDEQRVDEMIDAIVRPDAVVGDAVAEGTDSPEVMGELFVAADRLVHDPDDHEGTLALIAAIRRAETGPAPYGMDKVWWDGVVGRANVLVSLRDTPAPDEDAVVETATELRDALRPYV
ncbi:MAG: hypothetical protein ACRDZU_00385 [Acidimicrobiales bacterium]